MESKYRDYRDDDNDTLLGQAIRLSSYDKINKIIEMYKKKNEKEIKEILEEKSDGRTNFYYEV